MIVNVIVFYSIDILHQKEVFLMLKGYEVTRSSHKSDEPTMTNLNALPMICINSLWKGVSPLKWV